MISASAFHPIGSTELLKLRLLLYVLGVNVLILKEDKRQSVN